MKLRVGSIIGSGSYISRLTSVEEVEEGKYGPGLRWTFTISQGVRAGGKISRTTGQEPLPQNALGRVLAGLLGRPLKDGEEVDPNDLIGREYVLEVVAMEGGACRVESVELLTGQA